MMMMMMIVNNKIESSKQSEIEIAALQLLIHLQVNFDCREKLVESRVDQLILQTKCRFEGKRKMIVSLLQRLLEDDQSLKQSFKSSVKVCH